jgi:threonine dehydrogenase-like Zn-dependent dehydrogenase
MKALTYGITPLGWAACKLLKPFWPACIVSPLGGLKLAEVEPPPLPGPDWVRCRTVLGGICGSDLGIIAQRQPPDSILQSFSTLPAVFGHENVAIVEEAGSAVDAAWAGKRVTVEPTLGCKVRGIDPPCRPCSQGRYGACENFSANGEGAAKLPPGSCTGYCGAVGGSWGECFVAHQSQLIEPPAAMSDELAVLTDALACSLHAVLRADLTGVSTVLVYGGGMLGLGIVWALRAVGYAGKLDIIARHSRQADLARAFGATDVIALPSGEKAKFRAIAQRVDGRLTQSRFRNFMISGGYDLIFECTGGEWCIEEAFKWASGGGQVVMVGTGHGRGTDMTPIWFRELRVIGASGRADEAFRGRRVHTYNLAHELMLQTKADLSCLLTHVFPIEDYKAAMAAALGKHKHGSVKVAFRFPVPRKPA